MYCQYKPSTYETYLCSPDLLTYDLVLLLPLEDGVLLHMLQFYGLINQVNYRHLRSHVHFVSHSQGFSLYRGPIASQELCY